MRHLVQPKESIFVKGYGSLSFAENMVRNIGQNISKNLSGKCSQKLLDHAKKNFATVALKTTSKRLIQKTAEGTGDLIGGSKHLQQNNSETITNEHDKEISKESYISPQERQKVIDDLRLI